MCQPHLPVALLLVESAHSCDVYGRCVLAPSRCSGNSVAQRVNVSPSLPLGETSLRLPIYHSAPFLPLCKRSFFLVFGFFFLNNMRK